MLGSSSISPPSSVEFNALMAGIHGVTACGEEGLHLPVDPWVGRLEVSLPLSENH